MHKRPPALCPLLLSIAALLATACLDDNIDTTTTTTSRSGDASDDVEPDMESSLCPAAEPKIGEACPAGIGAQMRCPYVIDKCSFGTSVHDIVIEYCCFMGTFNQCAVSEPPCDPDGGEPGASSPVDAPVAAFDAGADARDAGADAGGP
jgi:hypothetical protein